MQAPAGVCGALGIPMKLLFEEEDAELTRTDLLIALLEQNRGEIDALPPEAFERLRAALSSVLALSVSGHTHQ